VRLGGAAPCLNLQKTHQGPDCCPPSVWAQSRPRCFKGSTTEQPPQGPQQAPGSTMCSGGIHQALAECHHRHTTRANHPTSHSNNANRDTFSLSPLASSGMLPATPAYVAQSALAHAFRNARGTVHTHTHTHPWRSTALAVQVQRKTCIHEAKSFKSNISTIDPAMARP
jgi:hypothetical protein